MNSIIHIIDIIFFTISTIGTVYIAIFTIASLFPCKIYNPTNFKLKKIVILFPVYKEADIIIQSILRFIKQDYPKELYDIVVIADNFPNSKIQELRNLPIKLLDVHFEKSSKALALNYAINNIDKEYDIVIILDADNEVNPSFLKEINKSYCTGNEYIQAHRLAANTDTNIAILDAVSEEINNAIFRRGHNNIGLSSALIGSGMAFNFQWFKNNVSKLSTVGEDKELELILHQDKKYIKYLNKTLVYDYKTKSSGAFHKQRRRWQAAQYQMFFRSVKNIINNRSNLSMDIVDKLFQWIMPSRSMLLLFIIICTIVSPIISIDLVTKWCVLFIVYTICLLMAIPKRLYNKQLLQALIHIPYLSLLMFTNFFHLRSGSQKFIHTKHS